MSDIQGSETYLLTFDSTHSALAAQKALESYGPHLIPTPRDISAGCGMSLRFSSAGEDQARRIKVETGLDDDASTLYHYVEDGYSAVTNT